LSLSSELDVLVLDRSSLSLVIAKWWLSDMPKIICPNITEKMDENFLSMIKTIQSSGIFFHRC